jgi:predicted PurR-regulated permease PerM
VPTNASTNEARQSFYVICGVVLTMAFLYWAQKILVPIALAVLLAFILTPAVSALERRRLGRLPSVILVVLLALVLLGFIGWLIWLQLGSLANNLPAYRDEISHKLETLQRQGDSGVIGKVRETLGDFWPSAGKKPAGQVGNEVPPDQVGPHVMPPPPTQNGPSVVQPTNRPGSSPDNPLYVETASPGWTKWLQAAGPAAEGLGDAFLVLVLVVFMLIQREGLRNRIVRLVGHGRLIVTTRAIDEGARRVSRYLIMQVEVNASFGVLLAAGLFIIGLWSGKAELRQYALLWGFLAGSLRFVPYVGTWLAAVLLFAFTVATLPGWALPLGVFAYYIVLELLAANVVEPLLFGHGTGVSPLALLLSAAFWTWLWGPIGLVLSTPMTVVVVVLGKYVPQLHFFEVLLGDEPALSPSVTLYQRLVARDQDEASELVEEHLQTHSVEATFEEVLLPALLLARRDRDRDELDSDDLQFVLHAMRDIIDEVSSLQTEALAAQPTEGGRPAAKATLIACPARDEADELALQMLAHLLRPQGYEVDVISSKALAAEVMERIGNACPQVVCVGSLPPGGLAQTRYLCKRIRQQCGKVKIVVGRWGDRDNTERMQKRLQGAGADYLGTTLTESRSQLVPLLQVAAVADAQPDKELAHSR